MRIIKGTMKFVTSERPPEMGYNCSALGSNFVPSAFVRLPPMLAKRIESPPLPSNDAPRDALPRELKPKR